MKTPHAPRLCTLDFVAEAGDQVIVTATYRGMPDPQKPEEYEIPREDWARQQAGGHVPWLTAKDEIVVMPADMRPWAADPARDVAWMSTSEIVAEGQRSLERMQTLPRGRQRNAEATRIGALVEMLNIPV